jgi:exodeoxyribonuclease VII small subunit
MAKSDKTYSQMQSELDDILIKMQSTDTDIDESIKNYEQGLKLIQQMEDYLSKAENQIKEIKAKFDKQ